MSLFDSIADLKLADRALDAAISIAPTAGKLTITLLVGVLLSRLLSSAASKVTRRLALEDRLERLGARTLLTRLGLAGKLHVALARTIWWLGLASTAYIASELMGWTGVSALFYAALAFIPRLFTAACILGVGLLGAEVASRTVQAALASRPDFDEPALVGKSIGALITVVAAAVSAEQLGFEVGLIHTLVALGFASVALAASLTFSLGGSPILAQLVAGYYARRTFSTGDVLDVHGVRGRLLHFAPAGVVLEDGPTARVFVPYRALTESTTRRAPVAPEPERPSSE